MPIQKAMCDEWTASKPEKDRLECVMKAIIRHTRGPERTGAHAERHWQWGADNYLHWKPVAAPLPDPLVHNRATPLEKQIAQTMIKAKQRMVKNWEKQKQTMEEDMWAAQDAAAKYVDGDMEEPPTQEERRSITKNVLALHGLADVRLLRRPERIITTHTPEPERGPKNILTSVRAKQTGHKEAPGQASPQLNLTQKNGCNSSKNTRATQTNSQITSATSRTRRTWPDIGKT